ncbi:MAG: ATP-binding protein, partial [Acidimicrobiia bacterium]|nr:ATP-binding protein [Acidimicrobiia bacterium]
MNKGLRDLSIQTKATLFVVAAIGLLTALMVTVHFQTSLDRIEQIENDEAVGHADRLIRQLDKEQFDVGGTNSDWAWWDDSYLFTLGDDPDWDQEYRDDNLYAEAFTPLGVNVVVYVSGGGEVLYDAWYTDDDELPVPDEIVSLALPVGSLSDFSEDVFAEPGGLVAVDDDLFLVTTRATTPSAILDDVSQGGVILMGRHLNDAFMSELSDLVGLDVTLEPCAEGSCAGLDPTPRITKTSTSITTDQTITDVTGRPAVHASISGPRTIYNESLAGIQRALVVLIVVGVAAIALTLFGLRRLIVNPVQRLGSTVAEISRTDDPSLRATVDRRDEIGELAGGLNVMLARLENSKRQLNEAKAQVEGASEAKSRFLSRVSHELRTPINGVLAYAQLLSLDHPDGESQESIQQIITSARHITSLVDEFLDIARIEAGSIPVNIEEVNPKLVAQEVINMTQPLAQAQAATVDLVAEPDALVLADPLRLRQSILNLVSNAIKYGNGDDPIEVAVRSGGLNTVIEVRDHGPGIPNNLLPRLFVPFDRLD